MYICFFVTRAQKLNRSLIALQKYFSFERLRTRILFEVVMGLGITSLCQKFESHPRRL